MSSGSAGADLHGELAVTASLRSTGHLMADRGVRYTSHVKRVDDRFGSQFDEDVR